MPNINYYLDKSMMHTRLAYVAVPEMKWQSGYLDGNFLNSDNALNVKFEVRELMFGVCPQAHIGVCNLSHLDIAELSNYFGLASAQANRKTVQLYVGYNGDPKLIYTGGTYKTTLTDPPDMWLNMETYTRLDDHKTVLNEAYYGFTFGEICTVLAAKVGLVANIYAPLAQNKQLYQFVAQGSISKVINDLCNVAAEYGVSINTSATTMMVRDKSSVGKRKIHVINAESGIIGVPRFNIIGADLTVILNPEIHPGDGIQLTTEFGIDIPNANGVYYVQELTHRGELRGNDFYTDLKLIRMK